MPSIIQADELKSADGNTTYLNNGTLSNLTFPAGHILQVVESKKTDVETIATANLSTFVDVSGTDQAGSGSVFCCKITPASSSNKVFVIASGAAGADGAITGALNMKRTISSTDTYPYQGDTASGYTSVGSASLYGGSADDNNNETFLISFVDSPNTTNEVQYTLQGATQASSAVIRINGLGSDNSGQAYSVRSPSSIILMEIAA